MSYGEGGGWSVVMVRCGRAVSTVYVRHSLRATRIVVTDGWNAATVQRWLYEVPPESCHTHGCVMSRIWISHITHLDESCYTCG